MIDQSSCSLPTQPVPTCPLADIAILCYFNYNTLCFFSYYYPVKYVVSIDTVTASLYLLYHLKVSNKVVSTKIINAHRAYHLVIRRRRASLRLGLNFSKVNETGVSAPNTRLMIITRSLRLVDVWSSKKKYKKLRLVP